MTAFKFGPANSRYATVSSAFLSSEGSSGADSITVESGGYLVSTVGDGMQLDPLGAWTVNVQGVVWATAVGSHGIRQLAGTSSPLTVKIGADGMVSGQGYGIKSESTGTTTITNAGIIDSDNFAIMPNGKATITNTGTIRGGSFAIANTAGGTTINNKGTIEGVLALLGDKNSLTNSGTIISGVNFGSGDDTLTNSGTMYTEVDFGDGNNRFTSSGSLFTDATFGNGDDTLSNSGRIGGTIDLDEGKGVVTNSGDIAGTVDFGQSDDKFTNSGNKSSVVDVVMRGGNNTFSNAGSAGVVSGGSKVDVATNTGTIDTILFGDGEDKVTNSGSIDTLDVGGGNDIVTNNGFLLAVILGDGDDKYIGGARDDELGDSNGSDTVSLGANNDDYNATGSTGVNDGLDKIDGGAGSDTYRALGVTVGMRINIDNIDHHENIFLGAVQVLKNRAQVTAVVPNSTLDDIITNFENVTAGSGNDVIYANAAANLVFGENGNDDIAGFGGNDELFGNAGDDDLLGGAGADRLSGGANADSFRYALVSDSGVGVAKRDVITDFTDGADSIILFMDANTIAAGYQGFDYLNEDQGNAPFVNFTGQAGQLRTIQTLDGYLIEGDVNGDSKADFQIEVLNPNHNITFTSQQISAFLILS